MSRRRRTGRRSVGGKKFDESKHRRKHGRFAEKPGSESERGPKPPGLKDKGVGRSDEIVDLSADNRSLGTVGAYADRHPGGAAGARRTLRRLHGEGRIGFRAAASERERDSTVKETLPIAFKGQAQPRDISRDVLTVQPSVLDAGLFRNRSDLEAATAAFTAGIPASERLAIGWSESLGVLQIKASNANGVNIERDFFREKGGWSVEHVDFQLPVAHRGGGHARRMMRASVAEYDRLGIESISVTAGGSDGGYVWARAGFVAKDERGVRSELLRATAQFAPGEASALRSALAGAKPGDLMRDVASVATAAEPYLGRGFLRGFQWDGRVDLTDARHRARLNGYFQ